MRVDDSAEETHATIDVALCYEMVSELLGSLTQNRRKIRRKIRPLDFCMIFSSCTEGMGFFIREQLIFSPKQFLGQE